MNLQQLIKERRSIASYQDKQVSIELIKDLLDIAIWVPNHKITEPWRFVFIQGDAKKKLAEINKQITLSISNVETDDALKIIGNNAYKKIMEIPFIFFVINRLHPQEKLREEDYAATSCVIQNFNLLAWEQGLSAFWKSGKLAFCEETAELIGLQENERIVGQIQVGYPAKSQSPPIPRESAKERITIIN
ncbi:nitroreductase family protein [Gracilibacillus boraciitolerans JCM 21714]|uniref:Putative NAD(P)H nitroreductase n=1 Tax=Gracilibacillus boraciitolerans JCM 21714 TaxID=1298598 RepID=W4VMG7_9BACI|nr:nitroreductase [Gracilibacillus boraciitolerans]GAE94396.1 nitroreductase family protein [Gracilibacillus boraciitolerans JCM 21714]